MNTTAIFMPVAILALWTLLVALLIPYQRFKAGFAKRVSAEDFKLGESERVPYEVSVPNRVFMNLLEAPVLFYVACMVLFQTQHVDQLFMGLAWTYLALRIAHSLVYLIYNNVIHRLSFYGLSNAVLAIIWWRLGIKLFWPG